MRFQKILLAMSSLIGAGKLLAAEFTVEDLHKAAEATTQEFKNEYGLILYGSINGINVVREDDGASITITYKQDSVEKSIEYFCHHHEGESLDCHEH